jgi:DNA polymerase III alpha subunit
MITNQFGEQVYSESDLVDLVMQGQDITGLDEILVDRAVDLETAALILDHVPDFVQYDAEARLNLTREQWDHRCQSHWFMPQTYQELDIAAYVLGLCKTDAELQRVGQELLMYQERDLFNLLRYLKYLVDTMREHNLIWGVGRGSSVASYVLYLLGVHRVNSIFYDLDPGEFLR